MNEKRPRLKRVRITKTKTFVQICKKLGSKIKIKFLEFDWTGWSRVLLLPSSVQLNSKKKKNLLLERFHAQNPYPHLKIILFHLELVT